MNVPLYYNSSTCGWDIHYDTSTSWNNQNRSNEYGLISDSSSSRNPLYTASVWFCGRANLLTSVMYLQPDFELRPKLGQMSEAFYKMPDKFLKNSKELWNLAFMPYYDPSGKRGMEDAYKNFTSTWDYFLYAIASWAKMHYSFSCIPFHTLTLGSHLLSQETHPNPSPFPFSHFQLNLFL